MFSQFPNQARCRKTHFAIGVFFCSAGLLVTAFAPHIFFGLVLAAIGAIPLCASLFLGEKNFENYDHRTSRLKNFNS